MNLISTLVHRALLICSPCKLNEELANIYNIFCNNGYLENVVKGMVDCKVTCFKAPVVFEPGLCRVYLKLPWSSRGSQTLADKVLACVNSCFSSVKQHVVFSTVLVFLSFTKDGFPYLKSSSVIDQFKC